MNNTATLVSNLQSLGLYVAAESLQRGLGDPKMQELDPLEIFDWALAEELSCRNNHRCFSLLKRAKLMRTQATLEQLDWRPERCLDRNLIERLKTGRFINEKRNLCIWGAAGTGKSYLGKAFGVQACQQGYRTLYVKFTTLMSELLHLEASDPKRLGKRLRYYGRIPVLVIDEWLLGAKKQGSAQLLLELLDARFAETTTIFCSQINPEGWPMAVDVQALGESILGRAASNSFRINLKGEDLRQVYATKP